MEHRWTYKEYQIDDALKPGSTHFQYFYLVSQKGRKKCNYCVWIEDDALVPRFGSEDFNAIVSSHKESWDKWVRGKIDAGDFGNKVLKIEKDGEKEIELSELSAHLSMGRP